MNSPLKLRSLTLACVAFAGALQAGSPKGIPDLPPVVTPTLNDQVELWQPGGASPHDHNMTLGQLSTFLAIPAAQVQCDWNAVSGIGQILNKPTLFSGVFVDMTSKPTTLSGYGITNAVANTITVNGHALSSNVTVAYSELTGLPTLGTSAAKDIPAIGNANSSQVVYGTDTRLNDARTPSAHAAAHKSGGTDAVKLDELAAPTDVTTLNATTVAHGLLPKLGGGTTNFLRADGTWSAPAGGGGTATALASATTIVDISAATAPTTGQVLTATDGTHATWQSQAGGGDMMRAVYDPQNLGYISGASTEGGTGGVLYMYGTRSGIAGYINTSCLGTSGGGAAGYINTSSIRAGTAGYINTSSADSGAGGYINTSGDGSRDGGYINTSGGGSISTIGTGFIGFGGAGTRTTVTGTATIDRAINWPDASGTVALGIGLNTANGVLKADGAGNVSAAVGGTDYAPATITLPTILTSSSITPVADGTYTIGIGGTTNGTITVQSGIITAVQQAVP